jgi:hypothetical protein
MHEAGTGSARIPIDLYHWGYKGSDPEEPDALCSQVAKDRLVSCS